MHADFNRRCSEDCDSVNVDTYSDAHKRLVERAFSTDDIELDFALIVMRYAIVFSICSIHASVKKGLHAHITMHEGCLGGWGG